MQLEAQITPEPTPKRNNEREDNSNRNGENSWFTGGNFWAQFGQNTFIDISPTIGYKVNEYFRPGIGISYQYQRTRNNSGVFSQSVYGGRAFGSYQLLENIIAYGELETLNLMDYWFQTLPERVWINNVWIGAGYRQWMGQNSALDLMVLYDLNYDPQGVKSVYYGTPWTIRMGIIIGL